MASQAHGPDSTTGTRRCDPWQIKAVEIPPTPGPTKVHLVVHGSVIREGPKIPLPHKKHLWITDHVPLKPPPPPLAPLKGAMSKRELTACL